MTTTALKDPLNPPSSEFLQDPYRIYSQFREQAPVYWSQKGRYWMITRHADALHVLSTLTYEKQLHRWKLIGPIQRMLPPVQHAIKSRSKWMLNMDPPDHTRMRSLVNKAFTPSTVAGLVPHIEEIADDLISKVQAKGEMDVIHDFAFPLPVTVIAQMLGVPASDRDIFHKHSRALTSALETSPTVRNLSQSNKAIDALVDYFRPLIAQRRKEPKNDLISHLIEAEEQGNRLTEDELLQNCVLLLVAGHETTVNLIGNAVVNLLRHPDQFQMIKDKPEVIPGAVQETLRYDSPIQMVRRLVAEDTELAGQKIKKGDMLSVMLGSANHDPNAFENPDVFDITRTPKRNLAFGQGIRHCLGASLAEAEGRVALAAIAKRLPDMRMKSDQLHWRQSVIFRGVDTLVVSF